MLRGPCPQQGGPMAVLDHEIDREQQSKIASLSNRRHFTAPDTSHPVLTLQQQAGNQAVQRLLRSGLIHAQLGVTRPGDSEEREADQVADRVMRSPAPFPASATTGGEESRQRQQNQPTGVARKPSAAGSPRGYHEALSPVLGSSGQPLDAATRSFFEPKFGRDFSRVRVHTGSAAGHSAAGIHALAYTSGDHIVFGASQFNPSTATGQRLLAHELAHVAQQVSQPQPKIQRAAIETQVPKDVDLKGGSVAFDLPGNQTLSTQSWHGVRTSTVTTSAPTTVTLSVDATSLRISFSPPLLVKPLALSNMQWSGVTYNFATGSTTVDLTGGVTSPEGTARADITAFFSSLISGTPVATPGYNPLKDSDPAGTLAKIKSNFTAIPPTPGAGVSAADMTHMLARVRISLNKPVKSDGLVISGDVYIAAKPRGTAADLEKTSPVLDSLTISGDSIVIQKDNADVAKIDSLTVANGGAVTIDSMTLLGQAKEAAKTETAVKGLLLILLLGGGSHGDRMRVAGAEPNLDAEIVPGLTRRTIETALTKGVQQLILEYAKAIPGYDLRTIFGVPAPAPRPDGSK
jgi:hypothetical protein